MQAAKGGSSSLPLLLEGADKHTKLSFLRKQESLSTIVSLSLEGEGQGEGGSEAPPHPDLLPRGEKEFTVPLDSPPSRG